MERLSNEIVQLIFYEFPDPGPFTLISHRFHRLSQDPYLRARYFLVRYGPTEALFHAFARGRLLTERVLDVLLASGARLSRYLIQVAMHHYFHTQSHFIKTPWVRNVPFRVFTYFLKIAEEFYGDIPRGKGDDDGSIFLAFLKESKIPLGMRNVKWESIREILETYNFIPFSSRDPIMAQFPLALAIEPKLLPYAVKNGFHMDCKYRDFVVRKIFEKPAVGETSAEGISNTVRELCRLDNTMFVSRTVAAEVCMEALSNDTGYAALKLLDKSGQLRFEFHSLVEDLIKTFIKTRSISSPVSIDILRTLYTDFHSSDSTARLVILITLFISSESLENNPSSVHAKLEALGLLPVSKRDIYNILINPFVDRYHALLGYARWAIGDGDSQGGIDEDEIYTLVKQVASRCLELACKGRFVKMLLEGFPRLRAVIERIVLESYQFGLDDLPSRNYREMSIHYQAKLCKDFTKNSPSVEKFEYGNEEDPVEPVEHQLLNETDAGSEDGSGDTTKSSLLMGLGHISQETLSTMIRHDDVLPARSRRRTHIPYGLFADSAGSLPYPPETLPIAHWIKAEFGARSRVTAVFMTHAVINDNTNVLHHYIHSSEGNSNSTTAYVPVTFKHFQILARLGQTPNFYLYHAIESGAEFYFDEDDYLEVDKWTCVYTMPVKVERNSSTISSLCTVFNAPYTPTSGLWTGKRPRRMATAIRSYAVPGSDDETVADLDSNSTRKKLVETGLQKWLRHLGQLAREEQRKYKEERKAAEIMSVETGKTIRVSKNDFFKSLTSHIRHLRRIELEKRIKLYGSDFITDGYSDGDDDTEYKSRIVKRRRIT